MVESTIRYSKSGSSAIASNILPQAPLALHRLKRRNTLFQSPNTSGRSRQGEPVRTIHRTPSTNIRLLRPVEPFWSGRPMISPDIRSHAASLSTSRSITPKTASQKAVLNHDLPPLGISLESTRPRACSDPIESEHALDSLFWSHFLRRPGAHFGGKCSRASFTSQADEA